MFKKAEFTTVLEDLDLVIQEIEDGNLEVLDEICDRLLTIYQKLDEARVASEEFVIDLQNELELRNQLTY